MGTVFRFDLTSLTETILTSFTCGNKNGAVPFGPVSYVGASIYGSTIEGYGTGAGSNGNYTGYGSIWRLNAHSGKASVFHGFYGADGSQPYNPEQAPVVVRIFQMFADGTSPIAIAKALNAEGVLGPQGRAWRDTTIRGHAARETGILRNELYVGRLIWNRM